jgi:hypothetical protein
VFVPHVPFQTYFLQAVSVSQVSLQTYFLQAVSVSQVSLQALYAPLLSLRVAACPTRFFFLDLIIQIIFGEE